ncbi:lipase family protein [Paenibacillus koleovorans]|uniref:lipase family protein n=1 Tax=Paenibacillus koleovorans TaxID=121608 RepID=UPI000FD86E14|nr:lipase family protein [Paenibacillus koleovorans]
MKDQPLDKKKAIFLAAVCGQTYTQYGNTAGTFVVPKGYKLVAPFKAVSFGGQLEWFGFVLESASEIIVAFRGTSSQSDWMSNAMARQVKYKYAKDAGWTHHGFTEIYSSARKNVLAALAKLSDSKRLFITGHSLGGALATLCALDVASNTKFRTPVVYTYGSPRVGNQTFADAFNKRVSVGHRIANQYDVVPHLPPVVYPLPLDGTIYYYMHVRELSQLTFQDGSMAANHIIADYFNDLSKLDPTYAKQMCKANAGFCPG